MNDNKRVTSVTVKGLRGFSTDQTLHFAVPDGKSPGSGLTIIVGPNSGGKTSIVEAIQAVNPNSNADFSREQRNKDADDKVSIVVTQQDGQKWGVRSQRYRRSATQPFGDHPPYPFYVVRSRRRFQATFPGGEEDRRSYMHSATFPRDRTQEMGSLPSRLRKIASDPQWRQDFTNLFCRILGQKVEWYIDMEGNAFRLFLNDGTHEHSSDGIGDGFISLLYLADALYDSEADDVIVIDEPELSLHPIFQRRVQNVILEYSTTRQIVLATHSPYFVDWNALANGAKIARVWKDQEVRSCVVSELTDQTSTDVQALLHDAHNPHTLGTNANEAFFLEDRIVLVEGQEDALHLPKIANQLDLQIDGTLFGWGVGGADKMRVIVSVLKDLGYRRVVGVLDADKAKERDSLAKDFPEYTFVLNPRDDVRDKPAQKAKPEKTGLVASNGTLHADAADDARRLIEEINAGLRSAADADKETPIATAGTVNAKSR